MSKNFDVAVIGAGAVGCSCALWNQEAGFKVALIDKSSPTDAASYGNAGIFSMTGFAPINSPGLIRRLPKLMFGHDTPLSIDWVYALTHLPWMMKFLRACSAEKVAHITEQLANITNHVEAGFMPLAKRARADDLVKNIASIYIYSTREYFDGDAASIENRRRLGANIDVIEEDEVREMEPHLRAPVYKALRSNDNQFISNPGEYVQRLKNRFTADGGEQINAAALSCAEEGEKVHVRLDNGSTLTCNKLVIAAGAHSRKIIGSGAEDLPLDTERGYHVVYHRAQARITGPIGWSSGGLYASPMDNGLRIAGTVELAGLDKPPSPHRIRYISRMADKMFASLGEPDEVWMGFRPTLPDSLPVIGVAPGKRNILLAFGHQHLGLTMSGITGRVIADLAQGRAPNFDISGYSPNRFD
jgi:glycine/D-amino acid oxidase-like deaminating enzyme